MALLGPQDAVGGVAEPDRAVRLHDDIIGGVQPHVTEPLNQRLRQRAVARPHPGVTLDGSAAVGALDDVPVEIEGASVGELDAGREDREVARLLAELENPVVGDVAEADAPALGQPDRPLRPDRARADPLQHGVLLEEG